MNIEIDPRKGSVLCIETTPTAKGGPDGSKIVITGSTTDIIFNWIALTASICGEIGIPAAALALMLQDKVAEFNEASKAGGKTVVDLSHVWGRKP